MHETEKIPDISLTFRGNFVPPGQSEKKTDFEKFCNSLTCRNCVHVLCWMNSIIYPLPTGPIGKLCSVIMALYLYCVIVLLNIIRIGRIVK